MSTKTFNAGDVELTQFDIVSLDGSVRQSIISQVISFDIYESVMLPVMYCEILMNDAINLIEKFPIIGEEFIEIEFKNPELNSIQEFRFKTASITNKFTEGQGNRLFYMIQCASEETLWNSINYIQRRYSDGNPYDMVSDILRKDLKSNKKLNTDDVSARGTDKITISQMPGLQAIDMIRKRVVSKKYKSSSYVFFENREGFNFTTLEHLIFTGKNAIGDKIFFYDSNINDAVSNINVRNILAYQQLSYTNTSDLLQSGGLSNRSISLDLRTGTVKKVDFNFADNVDKFAQTDPDNISKMKTSSFTNKYGVKAGNSTVKNTLIPKSSNNGESFREESSGYLQSFISQLTQNVIRVMIYGDAGITVGNVIKIKLPEISGSTNKKDDSKLSSGNFLITKCRHMFVVKDKVSYKMAIECVKPSFGESDV